MVRETLVQRDRAPMRRGSLAKARNKAEPRCGGGSAFSFRRKVVQRREARAVAALELWLNSGEKVQIRVEDPESELAALKTATGRFAGEFADLTGPALGIVRVDAIVAVVIR